MDSNDWTDDVPPAERMAQVENAKQVPGMVWLGDLSGWEVGIMRHQDDSQAVCLYHRCGWARPLRPCGIASDHGVYLANIVELAQDVVASHQCEEREPSPEHQERMARWMAAAGIQPSGNTAMDQVAIARDIARAGRARRTVDGPGCTPFVPGVLDAVKAVHDGAAASSGHGPEDYDGPAMVADDRGELVPAGSLYADKCAECTTGVTCEAAGSCQFEG